MKKNILLKSKKFMVRK